MRVGDRAGVDARDIVGPEGQKTVSDPVHVIDTAFGKELTESRCDVGRHQNGRLPLRVAHLRRHVTGELVAEMRPLDLRVESTHALWSLQLYHCIQALIGLADAGDFGLRSPHEGEASEVVQVGFELISGQHHVRYNAMSVTNGQHDVPDTLATPILSRRGDQFRQCRLSPARQSAARCRSVISWRSRR